MYIIISGSNNITLDLAKKLIAEGHEITFIDPDKNKSDEIEKNIGFVSLVGTSYNKNSLIEAGIERADIFVASNINDEINFVATHVAKNLNEEITTINLINNIDNKNIFLGDEFDYIVEFDEIISGNLHSFISEKSEQIVYTNTDNHTEIVIIDAGKGSDLIGKSVEELNLPSESEIIAIISSSGTIEHNFANTINPLDKILIQIPIRYKAND